MKVWQLGQSVVENLNLRGITKPHLINLAQQTGETVYLAVRDGLSVIYIDKIDSTKPIRSFTPKGGSAPLHCVATGKVLLAADYDTLRDSIRERLTKFTSETITSIRKLDADMQATRDRGYSIDNGEYRERIHSFASPIYLPNGKAIAALGVSAPDVNFEDGRAEAVCQIVKQAADAVSLDLANHK
jgi:DNA-binding IclR family transcriptional regulator